MKRLIGIAILLVAVGALLGWKYLQQKIPFLNGDKGNVAVVANLTEIEIKGQIGGEKAGFLGDPDVAKVLLQRYKLRVSSSRAGSLAMMRTELAGIDFLWPASRSAADTYHGRAMKVEDIFNSPIVVYSWAEVVQALSQPLPVDSTPKSEKKPIVQKIGDCFYIVDLPRLIRLIESKVAWAELGLPQLNGSVKVIATNPLESNSGYTFSGLLANTLNGEIPDTAQIDPLIPRIRSIFARIGRVEDSSGTLFKNYLSQGLGAYPMVVGYENQLLEFSVENPGVASQVSKVCRILYPKPTTWSSHPIVALTDGGKRLADALQDPEIQRLAWERHGFRVGLMSSQASLTPVLKEIGVAPTIESVQQMPTNAVMEKVINGLAAQ